MYRNRATSTVAHILRGVLILLFFSWAAVLLCLLLASAQNAGGLLDMPELQAEVSLAADIYATVLLLFLFYSVARAIIVADHRLCMGYVEDTPDRGRKALARLCRTPAFLLEMAVCLLLCLLVPLEMGPFIPFVRLLARVAVLQSVVIRLILLVLFGGLFAWLLLLAHRSAMREWDSYHERLHQVMLRPSAFARFWKRPTGVLRAVKQLLFITWLYPYASYLLWVMIVLFFIPVFSLLIAAGNAVWYILTALVVLSLLGVARRYVRALRMRRSLLRQLDLACREKGIEHTPVRRPYRSLFRLEEGPDFSFEARGVQYDVKLLHVLNRRARVFFALGNQMVVRRTLRLFRREFELFHIDTTVYYAMEGDHKKLLVMCPVAARMFASEGGRAREIDTGDCIANYTLYTTTGFIHAIERDCLPRA